MGLISGPQGLVAVMLADSGGQTGMGDAVSVYEHTETDGSHGGTATTGAWRTLPFDDAAHHDGCGLGAMSSSAITVPTGKGGTYLIEAWHSFANISNQSASIRIYDTDGDAAILAYGSSQYYAGTNFNGRVYLSGVAPLTAGMVIECQYQTSVTRATDGLGNLSTNTDSVELYGQLRFTRMSG